MARVRVAAQSGKEAAVVSVFSWKAKKDLAVRRLCGASKGGDIQRSSRQAKTSGNTVAHTFPELENGEEQRLNCNNYTIDLFTCGQWRAEGS